MTSSDTSNKENQEKVGAVCWQLKRLLANMLKVPEYSFSFVENSRLLMDLMNFEMESDPFWDILQLYILVEDAFLCEIDDIEETDSIYDLSNKIIEMAEKPVLDHVLDEYREWLKHHQAEPNDFTITDIIGNGRLLQFCSEEMRSDRDTVLAAVQNNPLSFIYASPDMIAEKELSDVVLTAMQRRYRSIKRAMNRVDPKFLLLGESGEWEYVTRTWKNAIKFLVERLQGTAYLRSFFMNAIEIWADILAFAPKEIRQDREIAKQIVDIYPDAIKHMDVSRKDKY